MCSSQWIIPNTTQAQFVDCEGGKIHVFSRKMDDPDPKSPYATFTFPIIHLICPPKFCLTFVFSFLLGITAVPREIENKAYAKFWGANKVHYVENVDMAMKAFNTQRLVIKFPERTP